MSEQPKYDPSLEIPPTHICEAASLLESYFTKQGSTEWELMGVASRKRVWRADEERNEARALNDTLMRALEEIRDARCTMDCIPLQRRAREALEALKAGKEGR